MELPLLNGIIDRRILINYRVDPQIIKNLLPAGFSPLIVNGYASAGICILRLKDIGIKFLPDLFRFTSENVAHRILIERKDCGADGRGVYIPRRDTDSYLNVLLAGKLFSWPHYMANFKIQESGDHYSFEMNSKDKSSSVQVEVKIGAVFPADSMFGSLEKVSDCFKGCAVGYSPSNGKNIKGIELRTERWEVEPLELLKIKSSFFENESLFPEGSIEFDISFRINWKNGEPIIFKNLSRKTS